MILSEGRRIRDCDLILDELGGPLAEEDELESELPGTDDGSWEYSERLPGMERLGNELRQQEHQIILDTLIACQGSRKEVAERLGISPRTLRYKLARMRDVGIEVPD